MSKRSSYQLHESTPLVITEVPKCQPQLQPTQALCSCNPGGEPPRPDGKIVSLRLSSCSCILILLIQQPMLILEVCLNVGLGMLHQGLCPMEQTCYFLVLHWNGSIIASVNYPNCIPVSLSTVCHECFELGLRDTMLCYNNIQILLKDTLGSCIFLLHVIKGRWS
jgi:hypothetical protein